MEEGMNEAMKSLANILSIRYLQERYGIDSKDIKINGFLLVQELERDFDMWMGSVEQFSDQ